MSLIVITGANGQTGSYLADCYRNEGHHLALLCHERLDRLASFEKDIKVLMRKVTLHDFKCLSKAGEEICSYFGKAPEILIHCAAIRSYDAIPLADTDPVVFNDILMGNITSAYNILRWAIPLMLDNKFGRVVFFGSTVSQSGLASGSAYAAAKAAMISLVKSVAKEVAKDGIVINAISPAPVETSLENDYTGEYLQFRKEYFSKHLASVPTGKLVSMKEIKRVIDMLIDPGIENLTGEEIMIRGGMN